MQCTSIHAAHAQIKNNNNICYKVVSVQTGERSGGHSSDQTMLASPFKTLTVILSVLPCHPSSAAASAFIYEFVLASSMRALTFSDR